MYDADILIKKLMVFYNVFTISELSNIIGVSQPSISGWKKHNYVKAIANKCKELGIYNEIFGDLTHSNRISVNNNTGQIARTVQGNMEQSNNSNKLNNNIDEATMGLIAEAYKKALDNNSINEFRIYIMEYK